MGFKLSFILILLICKALLHAQEVGLRETVQGYFELSRELIQTGNVPLVCHGVTDDPNRSSVSACENFYKYTCDNMAGTTDSRAHPNTEVYRVYEEQMQTFFESTGANAELLEKVNNNNLNPQGTIDSPPLFKNTLSETVNEFETNLCNNQQEDNATNRRTLIEAMRRRYEGRETPIWDLRFFINDHQNFLEDIQIRCREICINNGGESRACSTECRDNCQEGSLCLDTTDASSALRRSGSSDPLRNMAMAGSRTIVDAFNYMDQKGFSLAEMCQGMTNVLVNTYDSFYARKQIEGWNTLPQDQRSQIATNINTSLFPNNFRDRVSQMFSRIQSNGMSMFANQGGTTIPQSITDRLGAVQINWNWADPNDIASVRSSSLDYNAAYFNNENEIRIMGGARDMDPFRLMFVLSHEYGHAMHNSVERSPREVRSQVQLNPSHTDLNQCFRRQGLMDADYGVNRTGECMGDYYGTEIFYNLLTSMTPELSQEEKRTAVMKSVLGCGDKSGFNNSQTDPHPSWNDRANKIILSHPGMRELFGCSVGGANDPVYCPSNQTTPTGRLP